MPCKTSSSKNPHEGQLLWAPTSLKVGINGTCQPQPLILKRASIACNMMRGLIGAFGYGLGHGIDVVLVEREMFVKN